MRFSTFSFFAPFRFSWSRSGSGYSLSLTITASTGCWISPGSWICLLIRRAAGRRQKQAQKDGKQEEDFFHNRTSTFGRRQGAVPCLPMVTRCFCNRGEYKLTHENINPGE
ncbi:hypothetical protein SAMN04487833_11327 [Sarcina sp. DSM 11001]|nr:hypothetical protein SAMN04487833_11327 [Sarcina sp. DSM 11001]